MNPKRERISGPGILVRGNDIDTDRIIPARFLRTVVFDGLGEHVFEDDRKQAREGGSTHPFDDPKFAEARVLVVNANFGCGSSREHAPQAIMRWGKGIGGILGESFAEIFLGNCVAIGVPCATADTATVGAVMDAVDADPSLEVVLDVGAREVSVGDQVWKVSIPDGARRQFLDGRWDSTTELLAGKDAVAATAAKLRI